MRKISNSKINEINFKFILLLLRSLPFDWKTPCGYLMASIFILTAAAVTLLFVVPISCFVIGFAWIAIAFVKQGISNVHNLNEITRNSNANHFLLLHSFGNIVQDFSDIKELSANLASIHQ